MFLFDPLIAKLLDPLQELIGVYRWKGHLPFGSYTTIGG
jgi:hypothetical protein